MFLCGIRTSTTHLAKSVGVIVIFYPFSVLVFNFFCCDFDLCMHLWTSCSNLIWLRCMHACPFGIQTSDLISWLVRRFQLVHGTPYVYARYKFGMWYDFLWLEIWFVMENTLWSDIWIFVVPKYEFLWLVFWDFCGLAYKFGGRSTCEFLRYIQFFVIQDAIFIVFNYEIWLRYMWLKILTCILYIPKSMQCNRFRQ